MLRAEEDTKLRFGLTVSVPISLVMGVRMVALRY